MVGEGKGFRTCQVPPLLFARAVPTFNTYENFDPTLYDVTQIHGWYMVDY